jgi:thioesterase domain-containing protein
MAEKIETGKNGGNADNSSQLLVAVQSEGSLPPLFCSPGRDGSLFGFWNLARRLGSARPVFAFAAAKADGSNAAIPVEKMASDCIRLMRGRQSSGPYFLLGNCFGGLVALEMACQLSRDGEEVALLFMLDCFNHAWRRDLPLATLWAHKARQALRRSRFHLSNLGRLNRKGRLDYIKYRIANFRQETRIRALQHLYDSRVRRNKPIPRITSDLCYASRWAERFYRRQTYSGAVALFRTTNPAGGIYPAPLMGWKGFLQGRVEVYELPGEHLQMLLEPAVDRVAEVLRQRLKAAADYSN